MWERRVATADRRRRIPTDGKSCILVRRFASKAERVVGVVTSRAYAEDLPSRCRRMPLLCRRDGAAGSRQRLGHWTILVGSIATWIERVMKEAWSFS
jgi:hypothetical protein